MVYGTLCHVYSIRAVTTGNFLFCGTLAESSLAALSLSSVSTSSAGRREWLNLFQADQSSTRLACESLTSVLWKAENACPLESTNGKLEPCAAVKRLPGAQGAAFGRHMDILHGLGGLGPVLERDTPDTDKADHRRGRLH